MRRVAREYSCPFDRDFRTMRVGDDERLKKEERREA